MPHKPGFIHSGEDENSWNYFELPFGKGADYKQPIPLEKLPYTPVELGEMLESKEKEREIEIEGLGKGRLIISKQNKNKPFFYPNQSEEFVEKKSKQLQLGEIGGNLPLLTSPLTTLGKGVPKIVKTKTETPRRLMEMSMKESSSEGALNLKKNIDGVFSMPSSKFQRIKTILRKNPGMSYQDAMQYVNLVEKGTPPTKNIKPGNITGVTNKGLLKDTDVTDPTVYIPPDERIGTQKGDPLQMKFDPSIKPEQPFDRGDIPTFDLSTMVEPIRGKEPKNILSVLNQNGMRGGRADIFAYRRAGKDRKAVEYYLSPYSKMIKFDPRRNMIVAAMNQKFGGQQKTLGLGEKRSFQAHHVVPIKASFPAFHGIVKESPKYNYYMKLYHDELLTLGNQLENIVPAIGAVDRDYKAPHHLVHMMIEATMGKAGEKFWDNTTLESLVVRDETGEIIGTRNDEMRERLIRKQIKLFKRAEDIIKLGMEEYSLYASNEIVPPEVIVEYFTDKLPTDLKYEPQIIKNIVNDAMQDMTGTFVPSVIGGTISRDTLDIIRDIQSRPANWWSLLSIKGKKDKLPELTESYPGSGDGYTFEQIDELIQAGQFSDSMMRKLLSADNPDFEGFINELFRD